MRISNYQITQRITHDMMRKQIDVASSQERIATGLRVNRPSDDPAAAGQLQHIDEASSQLDQYNRNSYAAETRLVLEETALATVAETVMRLRELALSANSGAVDDSTRSALLAEVEQRLNELYDTANSRDSNGDYLFSGSNGEVQPFVRQVPVGYIGSDDSNQLPIGLGRTIQLGDSGAEIFQRIRTGNGHFSTDSGTTNTGTALISLGSVTDLATYNNSQFRIEFTSQNSFNVINADTGNTIQNNVSYVSGTDIEFGGITVGLTGSPEAGDLFTIRPSANQDLFTLVANFENLLRNSPDNSVERANQQQNINSTLADLDQALDHINSARSRVGSRLTTIDTSRDENASVQLQLARTKSEFEDADITQTAIQLQANVNSLEALQKSYVRIQNMSLFNFI